MSVYEAGVWQTFTADNSILPPRGVHQLLEDSQGRIWAVTSDWKAAVYEAGRWRSLTPSVEQGGVWRLVEGLQGRVWAVTGNGLDLYEEGAWRTFVPRSSIWGRIGCVLEDSRGRIWVGSECRYRNSGAGPRRCSVNVYDRGVWQTFTYYSSDDSSDSPIVVRPPSASDRGVWPTPTVDAHFLLSGEVVQFFEDSRGRIWIGTGHYDGDARAFEGGVAVYEEGTWQAFTAENSSLPPGRVSQIMEDSRARIWVGASGGVSFYADGEWHTFDASSFPTLGGVRHMLEDSRGRIWVGALYFNDEIGTHESAVNVYDGKSWRAFIADGSTLPPGMVYQLLEDSQGRIWAGYSFGVVVIWSNTDSDEGTTCPTPIPLTPREEYPRTSAPITATFVLRPPVPPTSTPLPSPTPTPYLFVGPQGRGFPQTRPVVGGLRILITLVTMVLITMAVWLATSRKRAGRK